MSRYNSRRKGTNRNEKWEKTFEDRGVKEIQQYTTPRLKKVTEKQLQSVSKPNTEIQKQKRNASMKKHYEDETYLEKISKGVSLANQKLNNRDIVQKLRILKKENKHKGIKFSKGYYVGDKMSDLKAAHKIGAKPVLVRTGYGSETEKQLKKFTYRDIRKKTIVFDDLSSFADYIEAH